MLIRMILSPALHFFLPLVLAASDIRDTYDYGRDIQSFLHQRDISPSDSQNAIVASIPHNGSIPLRLELRELQKNSEQWNLYLLAVSWMQWMNQSDPASWYAITGKRTALILLPQPNSR